MFELRELATFSTCGKYRFTLVREWIGGAGRVLFVMLNPSTADAREDDPTIRRCISFAKSWGFASLEVVNLYAFRATRPMDMFAAHDPIGVGNDSEIAQAAKRSKLIVAAWGALAPDSRAREVSALIAPKPLYAIALTDHRKPRHPVYLRRDLQPFPFEAIA